MGQQMSLYFFMKNFAFNTVSKICSIDLSVKENTHFQYFYFPQDKVYDKLILNYKQIHINKTNNVYNFTVVTTSVGGTKSQWKLMTSLIASAF
jgi:hypothetical protein